jgi:hypothetical protein
MAHASGAGGLVPTGRSVGRFDSTVNQKNGHIVDFFVKAARVRSVKGLKTGWKSAYTRAKNVA